MNEPFLQALIHIIMFMLMYVCECLISHFITIIPAIMKYKGKKTSICIEEGNVWVKHERWVLLQEAINLV